MEAIDELGYIVECIDEWYNNPVKFTYQALGVKEVYQYESELMNALVKYKKVAVKSGHTTGKTCSVSWLIWWFMITRSCPKVIVSSGGKMTQLKTTIFSEVSKWGDQLIPLLRDRFETTSEKIVRTSHPLNWYTILKTGQKENSESFQGHYGVNILFIFDESSGIDDEIYRAAQASMMMPNAYVLLTGNPLRRTGYFHDVFSGDDPRWTRLTFNAEKSPIADKIHHRHLLKRFGRESMEYRVRVLGEFPLSDENALIRSDLIEESMKRDAILPKQREYIVWGADPARFGPDECVLFKRCSNVGFGMEYLQGKVSGPNFIGWIINELRNTPPTERPDTVFVEEDGLGGPLFDFLEEKMEDMVDEDEDDTPDDEFEGIKLKDVDIQGVTVGSASSDKKQWKNKRAEMWCKTRDWFIDCDPALVRDDALLNQLSNVNYKFTSDGAIQIEAKEQMKNRIHSSPDRGDALALTFSDIKTPRVRFI